MIIKESPIPLYFQLEQVIKEMIEKKELKPGDLVPSEREYAEKYQISRMTVRQAMNNLTSEGYLQRERGKGTFVAYKKFEQDLEHLTSFSEDMRLRGMVAGTKVLEFNIIKASGWLAKKLGLEEGSSVYEIKRLRLGDQLPIAFQIFYTSVDRIPGLTREIAEQSIYQHIENETELRILSAEQEVEATIARKHMADALDIKIGDPILYISRVSLTENDIPLEYVQSYYRADRYKYKVKINR
ncbi:GntR family transcriptional regulator [Oceanobacillus profundus]|uniref:GntR family transcriptional regulator n=1 Tax=Oceanobacillus profundus TaxID=372463 RepID=A0A417YBE0_9BACI|nr:GntR family transcriptional regulator [Oceanobacillus profundus]MBR3118835.1 GntR family transcriptional regulator [Oceanobacillus sp.]PAE27823.1 phosphonate metabolism transcriptional regulator PhnF [Paenibacillus sp. 7884-2]MCM3400048.1 GntR family transcriptional regulator [Oceanobacillus profundus]MDO6450890.1 GntR family transcriptional regulator [Oceanobacillus profundus]RHW29999.1 GntR family transcriptional regulator [Oceanobacillus profundus]